RPAPSPLRPGTRAGRRPRGTALGSADRTAMCAEGRLLAAQHQVQNVPKLGRRELQRAGRGEARRGGAPLPDHGAVAPALDLDPVAVVEHLALAEVLRGDPPGAEGGGTAVHRAGRRSVAVMRDDGVCAPGGADATLQCRVVVDVEDVDGQVVL